LLAPSLVGQTGAVTESRPRPSTAQGNNRQDAVQAAMTHQAVVAAERQGALYLRDLGKRCGVAQPALDQLAVVLNQAIAEWVQAHPPQMYQKHETDFAKILQAPAWTGALRTIAGKEAEATWTSLQTERQQRHIAAAAKFIRTFAASELRLTPQQVTALEPICQKVAEQSVKVELVRGRPSNLVIDFDRGPTRVLSAVQADLPGLLASRAGARDACVELALESERIRLICKLDDRRAHLLRACGHSEGQKQMAEQAAKEARAPAKADAPQAPALLVQAQALPLVAQPRRPRITNGLPDDACLAIPFWTKLRDSLLSDEQKALLAANPPVDKSAVLAARTELVLASLDSVFHLDPEQVTAIRPLAEKVVEQDLKSTRVSSLDAAAGFGMQVGRLDASPEERANMHALEDILDRIQFEVMKDKVGL
jgi:hypothetical protein